MRPLLLAAIVALAACSSAPSPTRPDVNAAPTPEERVAAIQFMPAEEIPARLADLEALATTDPTPKVRDQVVLRLLKWGQPEAIPVVARVHREDAHVEVAKVALQALRTLCFAHHGALQPDSPPGPYPEACTPAYDGSVMLPENREVPREPAAAFWAGHDLETKTLRNGEVWPVDDAARRRVMSAYTAKAREEGSRRRARP